MAQINTQPKRVNSYDQNESASKSMENYNDASSMQLKWIHLGKENIEFAVPLLPSSEGTLRVVDFACSHGRNSMHIIGQLLDQIQKRKEFAQEIENLIVYHNDLPDNDFDAVCQCVNDPEIGYANHNLVKSNNIQVETTCVARTYYDQIVESETIDFAFCYTSLHWMPEYRPSNCGLFYCKETGNLELTKWFNDMSDKYLTEWLELRYDELKTSGLLSFNICTDTNFGLWINDHWAKYMAMNGLDYQQFSEVNIPVFTRTKAQLIAILNKFGAKYELKLFKTIEDSTQFTKQEFKAITYNQISTGLAGYEDHFPNRTVIERFYEGFEAHCFNGQETQPFNTIFEWVLLQKI